MKSINTIVIIIVASIALMSLIGNANANTELTTSNISSDVCEDCVFENPVEPEEFKTERGSGYTVLVPFAWYGTSGKCTVIVDGGICTFDGNGGSAWYKCNSQPSTGSIASLNGVAANVYPDPQNPGYFAITFKGDINRNAKIDLADTIIALRILSGISATASIYSDVNSDYKVGIEEVIYDLQSVAGLR